MKAVGLDSSVVLRLLVGEPEKQAKAAQEFLDDLFREGKKAAVSDLVISEIYFALQHHYQVPKAKALGALRALFASGEITSSGHARSVLEEKNLAGAKPGFVDRLIHADYESEFGEMVTFERKASRLPNTQILA